ncbi:hypothetical protein IV417_08575 [Alphaproteobacteria bacterium KMM 3653]|uniref:Membrane-associated oxidoreductase n=1 Tax=Harenicola maris TaxID=2841044 RepID=A0AAP2CN27_9RHOB|nr:hypothetical protein [Harenicola maris]
MSLIHSFAPLSPAEEKLLSQAAGAERITLGDGEMPEAMEPSVCVRAELLRALLMGGTEPELTQKGLRLRGAWVQGTLDLQGLDCAQDITLSACVMESGINLVNAGLRGLHISGCRTGAIAADNAGFSGSVYLRGGSHVSGEVSLAGARITGDLQLCDLRITSKQQDAVFAPSMRVEGSVFLGNYPYADGETTLETEGILFLASARVAHDVFLTNCAVSLTSDAPGSPVFGATEEHGGDIAVSLARARIGGILYLQNNQINRGLVNLAGAEAARLTDEPAGPGANYPIRLDGFRYADFSRHTDTSPKARLEWLERRPEGMPFIAQPYEHLAGVLNSMGHRADAQTVLMRKEQLLRAENRALLAAQPGKAPRRWAMWLADWVLRVSIGYGFRPGRAIVFAVVLIAALGWFFDRAWHAGDMTPNAAPVLTSAPWIAATQEHPDNPGKFWSQPGEAGQDWETFNGYAYAADLVIPLVSLGQESAWAPSTSRSPLGRAGWWMRWFAKALGWMVTALAAAALTGVIRQD